MLKKPTNLLWAILVLWLAFGLRLYHLDFQSIWWDEGHSIFVAQHPIPQIPTLPAMDVHPPAYFALLHLWMNIAGQSEFALRFLSVIFSLLTVALLWRFAAFLSPNLGPPHLLQAPLIAALLAALSPMYIAYAQEVRSYALITFLALSSTFVLWRRLFSVHSRDTTKKRGTLLLIYIVLTTACLYTHYFTIFLLLFQNLMWIAWIYQNSRHKRMSPAKSTALWIASQIGIVLLFTPQLLLALRQVTSYTNPNLIPPTLAHFITHSWQAYTTGLTIDPTPAKWGMRIIAGVLVTTWTIIFITKPTSNFSRLISNFAFLLLWFLIPLVAYFIVLHRQPSFEPRYLMLVTPALTLLLALGLSYVLRVTHYALRIAGYVSLILTVAVFLISIHSYYTNIIFFKDDSAGVVDWLAAETTPNDVVYVDVPHPFHYYSNRISAPTRYLFVDIHTAANTFNQEASTSDRLFWITWWGSDTDPRGVVPFLAEKAGQQAGQLDYKGYKIQWFDLLEQTTFSLPHELTPANATFGDVLRLDRVALGENTSANEPVWATLHFTLLRDTDVDYKVSLRVRDEAGQTVAQLDRDLLNDRHFRTSAWPVDDLALNQAINVYLIPLPAGTPPGTYQLEAVIYNSQPPYPSEGVTGHETSDGVSTILGRITVAP